MNLSNLQVGQSIIVHSVKLTKARPFPQSGIVEHFGHDGSIKDRFGNDTKMLILSIQNGDKKRKFKFWSHNIEKIEML